MAIQKVFLTWSKLTNGSRNPLCHQELKQASGNDVALT